MRLLKGFRRLPYVERLRRLDLHFLNRRRLRGDLIPVYKAFSGGLDLDPSHLFNPPVVSGLKGHPLLSSEFCIICRISCTGDYQMVINNNSVKVGEFGQTLQHIKHYGKKAKVIGV